MAKCTNKTFLMVADTGSTFTKLVDVTEVPDLGGDPEKLDITTLSDDSKKTMNGLQSANDLKFKALYEKTDYEKLLALKDTKKKFRIYFGEDGVDGIWEWEGMLEVYPNSTTVNGVREMTFSISDEGEKGLHYVSEA